jgi:CDP-glycerol glycerophosphotransferase
MAEENTMSGKGSVHTNILIRLVKTSIILLVLFRNFLLKFILFFLSFVIPKSRNILFFSSVGNYKFPLWKNEDDFQFKESPKYLAIYCAKKLQDFVTVFHVPNKTLFKEIEKSGIKPTKGLRALAYMLRAKYLFVDNSNSFNPNASFLSGRFRIVQCWHGTPLKNMEKRAGRKKGFFAGLKKLIRTRYYRVLSACSHSTQVFKRLITADEILEIGYPRNDILLNPEFFSFEKIDEKLALGNYQKVFLYSPTFRKLGKAFNPFDKQFLDSRNTPTGRKVGYAVNPFDIQFLETLNKWLKENDYVLLIKQHPYVRAVDGLEELSNINDVSSQIHDIQELSVHTNVLITDYSSIIFDFALTGRPIIFYSYDYAEYAGDFRGLYYDYYQEMPGSFANTQEELFELMKSVDTWSGNEDYLKKYGQFKDKFNRYQDGQSCKRLFDYLLSEA